MDASGNPVDPHFKKGVHYVIVLQPNNPKPATYNTVLAVEVTPNTTPDDLYSSEPEYSGLHYEL